jgi:hypothetical protein
VLQQLVKPDLVEMVNPVQLLQTLERLLPHEAAAAVHTLEIIENLRWEQHQQPDSLVVVVRPTLHPLEANSQVQQAREGFHIKVEMQMEIVRLDQVRQVAVAVEQAALVETDLHHLVELVELESVLT